MPLAVVMLVSGTFGQDLYHDVAVPVGDGNILVHARFIREGDYGFVPELAYTLTNRTSLPWESLKLEFDIGGLCNGKPTQWAFSVGTSLGWIESHEVVKESVPSIPLLSLVGKVENCYTEIIRVRLILAASFKSGDRLPVRIENSITEPIDLTEELLTIKGKRDTDAAAWLKEKQNADDKQRIRDEAARQARLDEMRNADEAEAAQTRRIKAACTVIYRNTANKKVSDLTVVEEEKVRACQALEMYPPDK
jgi:hypothetical protein